MQRTPSDSADSARGTNTSQQQQGTSNSSSRSTSPRFPITRLEATDREEWQSKTIGRSFIADQPSTANANHSPRSSAPSTPTTSVPPSRTYHSLNYAPRQRNSLRPTAASIFQSHSSQFNQQQPQTGATSSSNALPSPTIRGSSTLGPSALAPSARASPLTSTSYLSSSPSYPTISLPDAVPPRDSSNSSSANDSAVALAKIQLQQMQDEARRLGLNEKSAGWLILEALQAATEGEWAAVAELLANGEATLLLPSDPPSIFTSASQISASFAYDHTVLGASAKPTTGGEGAMVVTLSGLRGRLTRANSSSEDGKDGDEAELTLQSFVTKQNPNLKDASARQELMEVLAPLPNLAEMEEQGCKYPNFRLGASNVAFPLPPSLNANKAGGGGQGAGRARSNSKLNAAGSRASASFAIIFGGSGRERRRQQAQAGMVGEELVDAQRLSPNTAASQENSDSEAASTLGLDVSDSAQTQTMSAESSEKARRTISVWVVDRLVRRSSVMRSMRKTLDARVKARLAAGGIDESVAEVVATFAAGFLPPLDSATRSGGGGGGGGGGVGERGRATSPISIASPPYLGDAEDVGESFQDLYLSIRDQLHRLHSSTADGEGEGEDRESNQVNVQLETVEKVLCEEVYDRIFNPVSSKDRFRDDALSSRIAALNVLGLSLRHLGLDVPELLEEGGDGVLDRFEKIVAGCGRELQRLEASDRRSPKDKLEVLVRAHKVVVEGLATLPKIKSVDSGNDQSDAKIAQPTSADLILPILIYSIVRSNPARLASNLLYMQRFRSESLLQGEASYCLVNVQAAVAFLEGVDVKDLGLDSSSIGAHLRFDTGEKSAVGAEGESQGGNKEGAVSDGGVGFTSARLRGRVAQEIGELAAGVMGSGVGVWGRRMMGAYPPPAATSGGEGGGGSAETSGTGRPTLRSRTSSNSTIAKATDYADAGEQSKDVNIHTATAEGKPSIGDRLASLSMLSRLGSSPSSSLALGLGHPSDPTNPNSSSAPPSIASPRAVSRELPGPPPPSKPTQPGRTTSYLAAQLNRITGAPRSLTPAVAIPTEEPQVREESEVKELPASLRSPYAALERPPRGDRPLHVVLASTGSVASVKVPLMVEELLRYNNVRVMVIATDNSLHFYDKDAIAKLNRRYTSSDDGKEEVEYGVKDLAMENLAASRNTPSSSHHLALANPSTSHGRTQLDPAAEPPRAKLWTNADEWSSFAKIGDSILHIELRRWADVVLVAPCSANTLAKLNAGICDDLLTSFMRALPPASSTSSTLTGAITAAPHTSGTGATSDLPSRAPSTPAGPSSGGPAVVLFPAMNTLMYLHPLTAVHLKTARQVLGYEVFGPVEKRLACGDLGTGAMFEWLDIVGLVVDRYGLVKAAPEGDGSSKEQDG